MENKLKRPIVIWLALAYLVICVVLNLFQLVRFTNYLLTSGSDGITNFLIGLGFSCLMIGALIGIFNRSSWGQRFAILCFILMSVFAFFNISVLLNWPDKSTSEWALAIVIVIVRVLLSFVFAIVFGVSGRVKKYFGYNPDSSFSNPPPPPSFDD